MESARPSRRRHCLEILVITRLFIVGLVLLGARTQTYAQASAPEDTSAPAPVQIAAPGPSSSAEVRADDEPSSGRKSLRDLSPEVLAKLTPEQLVEVLAQREITKRDAVKAAPPAVATIVPIAFFITIVGVAALILLFRFRKHEKLHETMQKMIEKGVEIPPSLILPPVTKDADLRKGLVLSGLGLAAGNALLVMGPQGSWAIGLIPLFPGLGYLAVARLARTRMDS